MSQQEEFTIFIVPLPVLMEDEPIHNATRPFCQQTDCPCHADSELLQEEAYTEEIKTPLYEGLLSFEEAVRIYARLQAA